MNKLHIHECICTSCSERVRNCVCWCTQHLFNVNTCACMVLRTPVWRHATLPAKNAHAPVHARPCNGAQTSLPWKLLRTYLESCASIVQAVVCRSPPSCLDKISRPTLFAQKTRWLMTRSPLRCRTSIIQSSALVQASSSLSMVRTRAWPRTSSSTRFYFHHFFRGFFPLLNTTGVLILWSFNNCLAFQESL